MIFLQNVFVYYKPPPMMLLRAFTPYVFFLRYSAFFYIHCPPNVPHNIEMCSHFGLSPIILPPSLLLLSVLPCVAFFSVVTHQ